jgi:hypothetical protein
MTPTRVPRNPEEVCTMGTPSLLMAALPLDPIATV